MIVGLWYCKVQSPVRVNISLSPRVLSIRHQNEFWDLDSTTEYAFEVFSKIFEKFFRSQARIAPFYRSALSHPAPILSHINPLINPRL